MSLRLEFVIIKCAHDLDVNGLLPLIRESEREGFRFVRRLYDDYISGVNRFDHPDEALFTAQLQNEIVGICGLNRDPYAVQAVRVGRVRRLYVQPRVRKHGVGRLLVSRIIVEARQYYETLTLRTDNPVADQFYRAMGFSTEPLFEVATHYLQFDAVVE